MYKILLLSLLVLAPSAHARNTRVEIPLAAVVESGIAEGQLDGSVRFYLAGAKTPAVERRMGEGISNKKTNAANKRDEEACRWVVLSALVAFQNSARSQGANAVVDMVSYYKKNTFSDPAKVECYAGAFVAGAALKGRYAKLAE